MSEEYRESMNKFYMPPIAISIILELGLAMIFKDSIIQAYSSAGVLQSFLLSFTFLGVGFVIMLFIFLPFHNKYEKLFYHHQKGYNVDFNVLPRKWFGWTTYEIERKDRGGVFRTYTIGKDPLKDIVDKHRSEVDCSYCEEALEDKPIGEWKPFIYSETRKSFYLFGIPFRKKIVDMTGTCETHYEGNIFEPISKDETFVKGEPIML